MITNSFKETKKIGRKFAKSLKPGDLVLLYGDLGAGKTTFIQGVAEGLGIKDRILSPTFVLMRNHSASVNDIKNLYHIDLYRIDLPTEIDNLGIKEVIDDSKSVTLIEWADRLKDLQIKKAYKIYIEHVENNKRRITIEN